MSADPSKSFRTLCVVAALASTLAFAIGICENVNDEGIAFLPTTTSIPGLHVLVGTFYIKGNLENESTEIIVDARLSCNDIFLYGLERDRWRRLSQLKRIC